MRHPNRRSFFGAGDTCGDPAILLPYQGTKKGGIAPNVCDPHLLMSHVAITSVLNEGWVNREHEAMVSGGDFIEVDGETEVVEDEFGPQAD